MDDSQLKNLIKSYKPNSQTRVAASGIKMLATVGPSASGKTTIMRALAKSDPNFNLAIGESTRLPRPNEQEYQDMVYRPEAEIIADIKAGNLFQVVTGPNGHLYCTRPQDFSTDKTNLYPLIPQGVRQFRALSLKFFAAAFIVPADFGNWQGWLDSQAKLSGWDEAQLAGRLAEAKTSYEFALNDKQMHFVLNDDIDKAAERLRQVGQGQAPDDEKMAREIAQSNFAKLIRI